ncbi:MAG: hypothetical protein RL434_607 [Pseudomonadota bacterium]
MPHAKLFDNPRSSRFLLRCLLCLSLLPLVLEAALAPIMTVQVAAPRVRLLRTPNDKAGVVAEVDRGRLLDVLSRQGDWYLVRLSNLPGATAWVKQSSLAHGDSALIPFVAPGTAIGARRGPVRYAEDEIGSGQEPGKMPGLARPGPRGRPVVTLPPATGLELSAPAPNLPRESLPLPDRWRIMQSLGFKFPWYDPYNQNVLKGDIPVRELGDDIFINVGAVVDGLAEFREVPIPVNPTIALRDTASDAFGDPTQNLQAATVLLNLSLTKGNTTYMPPELELRLAPVFNYNRAEVREAGVLRADPLACGDYDQLGDVFTSASDAGNPVVGIDVPGDDGLDLLPVVPAEDPVSDLEPTGPFEVYRQRDHCTRHDSFAGIQEFFLDYHLRDVSPRYDFDSIRVGIQPYTNDFRGFLFQDLAFGVRLFGNRDNNHWQYNLAWFRRIEKDTNSGLNDITRALREDDTFLFNVYRQDFPLVGFTSELSVAHNRNGEDQQYQDTNDFVIRPAIVGSAAQDPEPYQVTYLGYSGDGHLRALWPAGRLNLTTSTYVALGSHDFNPIAGDHQNIRAFFHASELSRDFNWIRLRGSVLYASGDSDPLDEDATGFDAIFENPLFAGADTSYWVRQGIPLVGGGGIALSGRNGVLANLRSSKEQGQSNFVNPGLFLLGVGGDFDIAPQLRLIANVNHLRFAETETLEFLRAQTLRDNEIGFDLSAGVQWRPYFNQNMVINASGAVLLAGRGLRDLYGGQRHNTLYSTFINALFTF